MKVEKFDLWKWYEISDSRTPKETLVEVITKRIQQYADFEFNDDTRTKFRRIMTWEQFEKQLPDKMVISFHIEWETMDEVTFDYSNLPEPIFTPHDKKTKRRAI